MSPLFTTGMCRTGRCRSPGRERGTIRGRLDVGGALHLGQHDLVQTLARVAHHFDDVALGPLGALAHCGTGLVHQALGQINRVSGAGEVRSGGGRHGERT
jgi:hypothetical protein